MKKLSLIIVLSIFLLTSCNSKTNDDITNRDTNNNNKVITGEEIGDIGKIKDINSDNQYKVKKYKSYENNDGIFKVTLFMEDMVYTPKKHIDIFSTVEYVCDSEEITIWHGTPYFNYTIFDGEDYYNKGMTLDVLKCTVLKKGEIYTIPFVKSGGWSNDDKDAKYWESYYKDKELKLPTGEYELVAYCDFRLSEDDLSYENKVEIVFEVE